MYAASSIPSVECRQRFLKKALAKWKQQPLPPTIEKIERVAATLKDGNYRSSESYLSQYRLEAERNGYEITGPLARAIKDGNRSCTRGIGPGTKSLGLPLFRLGELPGSHRPWVEGGVLIAPLCHGRRRLVYDQGD